MICYFIRHGQSQANADGVLAGQLDSPLTELGQHQAQHEGERLAAEGWSFDIIISSPLVRAYDTAVAVANVLHYPLGDIKTDPRLMERHVGELEGRSTGLLAEAIRTNTVGVESNQAMAARCKAVLDDAGRDYAHKTVLLVAHAGVGEVMKGLVEDPMATNHQPGLSIPNAQAFRLL
ncbi:MAG: histidine phosphatase family protein [Candidatus Saccharimonadales bacterium]